MNVVVVRLAEVIHAIGTVGIDEFAMPAEPILRTDMALVDRSKEALLRRFLRLPGGIPSLGTCSRVFRLLEPAVFEACFARDVAALAERIERVVAVYGKTARWSFDRATVLHDVARLAERHGFPGLLRLAAA